ncbi:MAG: polysaccharide deacetylase family protein [bacterium]
MQKNLVYICCGVVVLLSVVGMLFLHPNQKSLRASVVTAIPLASTTTTHTTSTSTTLLHIPIFIYHSVKPDTATETQMQKDYSITPEMFEQQLQYLSEHGYTPISMDELARELRAGTTSPIAKPVVLGFDDGWKNQYVYAFPLLKKYHMLAVFYIYTNPPTIGDARFMTWEQIKEIDAAGMEIADHTVTHPYMQKLTPEGVQHEVLDGKKKLEAELGKPVVHFASPFGYTSPELVALLKDAGFETGRTGHMGAWHSEADTLTLTGYYIHRDLKDFEFILTRAK